MTLDIREALERVVVRIDLEREEMRDVMRAIMSGQCTPAQIGGFLVGLRMKGESIDEITAAAEVMRELATPVTVDVAPLVTFTARTRKEGLDSVTSSPPTPTPGVE